MSYHNQERQVTKLVDIDNQLTEIDVGDVDATLTASQIHGGILASSPSAPATFTFPTASILIAADPTLKKSGYGRHIYFRNDGTSAITLAPGTGGTLSGSDTVAVSSYSAHYYIRYSNISSGSEAYQIIRL